MIFYRTFCFNGILTYECFELICKELKLSLDEFEVEELFSKICADENEANKVIDLPKFMKFMEVEYVQEKENEEEKKYAQEQEEEKNVP